MNPNTIRIVAAVVDTTQLTLYKESGETLVLPQGDPRIRKIVEEATPGLLKNGFADVDLTQENTYNAFEEKTGSGIKLFRVAKAKLKSLFGLGKAEEAPVEEVSLGTIPVPEKLKQTQDAVAEILANAVPVSSPNFNEVDVAQQGNIVEGDGTTSNKEPETNATETIVAVVDGKLIPGMEKIKTQFTRAAHLGSTIGMENFLKRLSAVIEDRSHSVEDLLKFLERGDLPIADDGSILIYKVLNRSKDKYVDCHTRKVEQWVGAYVCMDPSLVDPNRRNECSNGLHVARRGYVRSFGGDVCVLAKLAPEDVIAVPTYDANKMRVCGYHIIKELTKEQYQLLNQNKPITELEDGKRLLADAMQGNHIGKTHEVRITQQKGGGVQVTELDKVKTHKVEAKEETKAEVVALTNPEAEALDSPICPKEVVKTVEQLSRKEHAKQLYESGQTEALKAFKKAAKVSWEKLGVPDPDTKPPVPVVKATEPAKQSTNTEVVKAIFGEGPPKERIHKLLEIGITATGVAKSILELKKKAKKSWDVLGVTPDQVEQITKLAQ